MWQKNFLVRMLLVSPVHCEETPRRTMRHVLLLLCITLLPPLVVSAAAHAQSPFVLFTAQLNELDALIQDAEHHSDGDRQAARYRCLRDDLDVIEAGLLGFSLGEQAPQSPLKRLCGDYRGFESNAVITSTPQERAALARLAEEIRALMAGINTLERFGGVGRTRFGGEILRRDLRAVETGIHQVIQADRVAPRGFEALIGGRR